MTSYREFKPLNIAVLTISDSRTVETDRSGDMLEKLLIETGHAQLERSIVPDDKYAIRAIISKWIVNKDVDVILSTGGTGVTGRDGTPEAVIPLLDKKIDGFGEMFRNLSYANIGASTLQSRAVAGVANATYVFCLPGSPGACRDAWSKLISAQLDYRTRPCNLVELMPRLLDK